MIDAVFSGLVDFLIGVARAFWWPLSRIVLVIIGFLASWLVVGSALLVLLSVFEALSWLFGAG
ncbi:MAG: hypothetical protein ISN28_15765 [Ectothiorhodospiraceae bacterium AqS1]|nr:hypothetical protein [Ectothiorhodospiraceae bacterium AqS1]